MQQYQSLIMIALLVVGFYFLILRPQKKRQQAVQKTMRELEPGTRVLLNSGIFATIVSVGDKQTVVEISPGVELTILKQAIARVVTDADTDSPIEESEDEIDEPYAVDNPSALDLPVPPATPAATPSVPTVTPAATESTADDGYRPSATYSSTEAEPTSRGAEPTNPTAR